MAPAKDKWIRRFIIPETTRHKKGFTIYKVTSMIFLNSSHEEISKVSIWKRYNDFKKLHLELSNLHKRTGIKENFPTFPKLKYFGRFETEVIEERRKYALKFLEFIGRYSCLYSSDTFIKFFETGHTDNSTNDCTRSLSSDTSEDDHVGTLNDSVLANDITAQSTLQISCESKICHSISANICSSSSNICPNQHKFTMFQRKDKSYSAINLENTNIKDDKQNHRITKLHAQNISIKDYDLYVKNKNLDRNNKMILSNRSGFDTLNNNTNKTLSICNVPYSMHSTVLNGKLDPLQTQPDSTKYILIAAGHMSAAFKHESIAEYKEAFVQYRLGVSCLISGIQSDPDNARTASVKDKISKYLARAELLYNKHLNHNISMISKPVSELRNYKVLKIIKSVMFVLDVRINCRRIIKPIEKSSVHEDNISSYVLREQIPYMVHLYACVETDATIFLILQYASCGKLWDFIRLRYKASDHLHSNVITNHICTDNSIDELNSIENIHVSSIVNKIVKTVAVTEQKSDECMPANNNLQGGNYSHLTSVGIHNMEIPTTHLLEKSQKLLRSVNATLERSNFIASRLNDSKEMRQPENVSSLNAKIMTQICQDPAFLFPAIYHNSLSNSNSSNIDGMIFDQSFSTENLVKDVSLKNSSYLSINNNKNLQVSQDIYMSVPNGSCITTNSLKNGTDGSLYNNSTTEIIPIRNTLVNNDNSNTIYICKDDNIESSSQANSPDRCNNNINSSLISDKNCDIDEIQHSHLCREINVDEEQELWQIPEAVIRLWASEILLSLEALHQQGVIIFDFKPDNILLDDMGHIRLTYIVPQRNMQLSKLTCSYLSPESCIFSPTITITPATDIWSFGVILYELFTGMMFATKHPGVFYSHSTISIPSKLSKSARSLLCGMLRYHPEERLTINEIKRHSFFDGIDWSNMINSPQT